MDLRVGRCLFGALGRVVCVVVELAWEMAVQSLMVHDLSVFFASVNGWNDGCFDEAFSADDCYFGFFVNDVFA